MDELAQARASADKMFRADRASQALGIEVHIPEAGAATATMRIRTDMLNGFKVCHGGLLFALADTAFAFACNGHGRQAVAAAAQIEFLRPALLGDQLQATAAEEYSGRRSGHYTVTVRNQSDEIVALFRGRSATAAVAERNE
jgi:acyl-CoA thioesterase